MATCSSADSVLDAASQIKSNATKLNTFVNGTAAQTVQLGTGDPTPSLRKFVADAQDVVTQAALDAGQTVLDDVAQNTQDITALQDSDADIWQSIDNLRLYDRESPCSFLFLDPIAPARRAVAVADEDKILEEISSNGTKTSFFDLVSWNRFDIFLQPGRMETAAVFTTEDWSVLDFSGQNDASTVQFRQPWADASAAVVDEEGKIVASADKSGGVSFPGNIAWPVPFLSDGMVMQADASGASLSGRLSLGTPIDAAYPLNGQSHRIAASGRAGAVTAEGVFVPTVDGGVLHCFVLIGQSLCVGAQGKPLVTTAPQADGMALMLAGNADMDIRMNLATQSLSTITALDASTLTGFQDVVSRDGVGSGNRGQTLGESLAYSIARAEMASGHQWKTLWICSGVGGTAYSGLKQGTTSYSNTLAAVAKAKSLAEAKGWGFVVDALILKHGEGDAGNSGYYDALIEWQADYETDIKAITGQAKDIPMIMAMPSSFTTGKHAVKAMLRAHIESPKHWLTGPDFPYPYAEDVLHLSGPGYHLLGEQMVNAVLEAAYFGGCDVVRALSAVRSGTTVTATFSVPRPPLVIDTAAISEHSGTYRGFTYSAGGAAIAVTAAAVTDSGASGVATVVLTLAEEPASGQTETLGIGMAGHSIDGRLETTIPRANVRDSAGDVRKSTYDGRRLDNWAVHQEIAVTA